MRLALRGTFIHANSDADAGGDSSGHPDVWNSETEGLLVEDNQASL